MRIVREILHPQVKITIFHWNNRYLIKLEAETLEQTFKVSELDLTTENDLEKILDDQFIDEAVARFNEMAQSLRHTLERHL